MSSKIEDDEYWFPTIIRTVSEEELPWWAIEKLKPKVRGEGKWLYIPPVHGIPEEELPQWAIEKFKRNAQRDNETNESTEDKLRSEMERSLEMELPLEMEFPLEIELRLDEEDPESKTEVDSKDSELSLESYLEP